jgi:uncharacterized protein YecA (UPF0149 family)
VIVPPPDEQAPPLFAGDPVTLALAWFPEDDYPLALARWPELTTEGAAKDADPLALARWPELTTEGAAKDAEDHADYNRALQRTLQGYADAGDSRLFIAPIRIPAYLAWCAKQGRDPATARAGYAADLARRGDPSLIAWPPGRNQRCWCESGRKYKQCCGTPQA